MATAVRKANKKIKERGVKDVLVIGDPEWNVGISGLIAASLQGEYKCPCFVWGTDENGKYCGSCRAENIDLLELMNLVEKDIFEHLGGHKMAGGFTIKKNNIDLFANFLTKNFEKVAINDFKNSNFYLDAIIAPSALNENFYEDINYLAPFGSNYI